MIRELIQYDIIMMEQPEEETLELLVLTGEGTVLLRLLRED